MAEAPPLGADIRVAPNPQQFVATTRITLQNDVQIETAERAAN